MIPATPSERGRVAATAAAQTVYSDEMAVHDLEQTTLLVVEADPVFRETLVYHLRGEGFFVVLAADGSAAVEMARQNPLALILLALQLPQGNGVTICRQLRADPATMQVPIVTMGLGADEAERVAALEAGADDYVVKPFHWVELRARLRAILRRSQGRAAVAAAAIAEPTMPEQRVLEAFGVRVDVDRRTVSRNGEPIELNRRLFDLLVYMLRYRGIVLTRDRLIQHVWGYAFGGDMRTVDVHIRWLREKLETNPADPRLIQTVHGVGYRFRDG